MLINRLSTDYHSNVSPYACYYGLVVCAQVVEVVLAVSALNKGLYTVVATSLLGSILSNLLLVLGERSGQSVGCITLDLAG